LSSAIHLGGLDLIELALALVLVGFAFFWHSHLYPALSALAARPRICLLVIGALPVVLRLVLIPNHPIPTPQVADDFSYLLIADTLRHFRLANQAHPLSQFFATLFVLQQPTYSSIFSPGQGIVLAAGWNLAGNPWAGVVASVAAMCAGCYWMLRGWTTPVWSLVGGLFAALTFGALSQWMNSYWGGAVSGFAGCLVFGALPRFRDTGRPVYSALLGLGVAIQIITRPFESVLLVVVVVIYFGLEVRRTPGLRVVLSALGPIAAALVFTGAYNHAVTGSWTTLPYEVSRYQYGVPTSFTFQPNPVAHRDLTPEEQLDYKIQVQLHGSGSDTPARFFGRLWQRLPIYRFFFVPPLLIAVVAFFWTVRRRDSLFLAITVCSFAFGSNFYPYFHSHYIAVLTCVFVLISMIGLSRLGKVGVLVGYVCAFHFIFWYGVHLFDATSLAQAVERFETGDNINEADPQSRVTVRSELDRAPGKQLVFVRYGAMHTFEEWVYNNADIDSQQVIFARDLGEENQKLVSYYPGRTLWLLQPDIHPPKLTAYKDGPEPIVMEQVP
jgi:hypothetical protein